MSTAPETAASPPGSCTGTCSHPFGREPADPERERDDDQIGEDDPAVG